MEKLNPLDKFKQNTTQEYDIMGVKVIFKTLTTSQEFELDEFLVKKFGEKIPPKEANLYRLAFSIDSIGGVQFKDISSIKAKLLDGANLLEATVEELKSCNSELVYLLIAYLSKFQAEQDKRYKLELDFLKS